MRRIPSMILSMLVIFGTGFMITTSLNNVSSKLERIGNLMDPTPFEASVMNVIGNAESELERFYTINGQRAYTHLNGKPVEQSYVSPTNVPDWSAYDSPTNSHSL